MLRVIHRTFRPPVIDAAAQIAQLGYFADGRLAQTAQSDPCPMPATHGSLRAAVPTRTTLNEELPFGPPATQLNLVVFSKDALHAHVHALPKDGACTIGRSSRAEICIPDARASRSHARLLMSSETGVMIEDLNSANGTWISGRRLPSGTREPILPGEPVVIGDTQLIVHGQLQHSHFYLEMRLERECATAAPGSRFSLVRLRIEGNAGDPLVLQQLQDAIGSFHSVAVYGPKDLEVLLMGGGAREARELGERLVRIGLARHATTASYPDDGRTAQTLLEKVNATMAGRPLAGAGASQPLATTAMTRLRDYASRAASANINLLVQGETGVGKEVLVRQIHELSPRARGPLICINCAALQDTLVESELFGHEKAAFSGATASKPGLFETADGGTIFLDEIGEIPLAIQAKLLRAIQDRAVWRVGALRPRTVDVRFIAATNRDLEAEVAKGRFREDLYYRLNVLILKIPPLRERGDEIVPLAESFIDEFCRLSGIKPPRLSAEVRRLLEGYHYPGNVRELRNIIERALVLRSEAERELAPIHLPLERIVGVENLAPQPTAEVGPLLASSEDREEYTRILDALRSCAGNQTRAAEQLGMSRRTLLHRLDRLNIQRPRKR